MGSATASFGYAPEGAVSFDSEVEVEADDDDDDEGWIVTYMIAKRNMRPMNIKTPARIHLPKRLQAELHL